MKKLVKILLGILVLPVLPIYYIIRKMKSKGVNVKYTSLVDGFANYAFTNDKAEFLAKTRAAICSRCPQAKFNNTISKVLKDDKTVEVRGMYCDACGCALSAKIRSNKSFCPKNKW